jgi:dipeptidase
MGKKRHMAEEIQTHDLQQQGRWNMKYLPVLILASTVSIATCYCQNCFTILVGKNASTDGSVLVAHNEDDLNDHNFVDLHKVPRIRHEAGEKHVFLFNRDSTDEVEETYAYFWITGSKYAEDQYLNEWGVAITSNSSRSNVENGNGRVDHNLRRIVIERARTAREAVTIAGMLVEKYGYASSGRVYSIADPNEAWVLEVANGPHWIARRVPDAEVAIIPNYYVIDDFHEGDTANYLASPDIVEYAVRNGWYDPHKETSFNFRKVYGHKDRTDAIWNIARKWVILNQLAPTRYDVNADFPFSIKPERNVDILALINALGTHYENSPFACDSTVDGGSPHRRCGFGVHDTLTVCNRYNDFGCITQLRSWLPAEIGNVLWIAPRYPCIQPFIPWYYGTTEISPDYEKALYTNALANYNNKNLDYIGLYPNHACWVFDDFASRVDSCYDKEIGEIREWKNHHQMDISGAVNKIESAIVTMYTSDRAGALQELTDLSNHFAGRALNETREALRRVRPPGR